MASATPGRFSKCCKLIAPLLPVMPMAVRVAPGMVCERKPSASITRTTPAISASVALAFITTSISELPFFLCNGPCCKPVSRCLHIRVHQFVTAILHSHLNFDVSVAQQFGQRVDLLWRSNWIETPAADQDGTIF